MPLEYAKTRGRNAVFPLGNSPGWHSGGCAGGHHEGMAGRGGSERPQRVESGPAAGPLPVLADGAGDAGEAGAPGLLGDPSVAEVLLASRPESAFRARRMALDVLRRCGLAAYGETVELLVSELVGNAVRHTGAQFFGIRLRRRRGWIRVEVRDPSRALPCLLPVRELDISGRGLFLVDHLSDRWGVDLQPRGKTTWFELRVQDRA
ncbi:ATP-binding protein [Streptomyces sp. NPDC021020]|uniref:ATP-binding protein n=1 Tax=Streptomyces sp. NPDC021020 TaxID=3365109 RepID=UPI00378F3509